jgi:DNA adenine methylase
MSSCEIRPPVWQRRFSLVPFLKWPGGKRWFIASRADLLPKTFNRYIEPFLGGGSIFFYLQPEQAILADCNAELISVYKSFRYWKALEAALLRYQERHDHRYYYEFRDTIPVGAIERAARTIYVNRTCFNGMYRVNRAGQFDVPKGERSAVVFDTDDFRTAAKLISRAKRYVSDFEPVIDGAESGDFVFADPPYIAGHNDNGFIRYNDKLFKWRDPERLANALRRASERGVKIVATNAGHCA